MRDEEESWAREGACVSSRKVPPHGQRWAQAFKPAHSSRPPCPVYTRLPGEKRREAEISRWTSAFKFVERAAAQVPGPGSSLDPRGPAPLQTVQPSRLGRLKDTHIALGAKAHVTFHVLAYPSLNFVNNALLESV